VMFSGQPIPPELLGIGGTIRLCDEACGGRAL
jgi:hypothetical protein